MASFIIASRIMLSSSLSAVLSPWVATTKYFPFSRLPLPVKKHVYYSQYKTKSEIYFVNSQWMQICKLVQRYKL
jgi:hypothetical protein